MKRGKKFLGWSPEEHQHLEVRTGKPSKDDSKGMSEEARGKPGKPRQESIYKRKCFIYSVNIYGKS